MIFLLVVVLRKEIRVLIPSLQKLKIKDIEFDFEKKVEQLEKRAEEANLPPTPKELTVGHTAKESIEELIQISPRMAIVEAFNYLEAEIRKAAIRNGIAQDEFYGVRNAVRALIDKGVISENMFSLFNDLRTLRNGAAHSVNIELSAEEARIYAELALRFANAISIA